MAKLLQHPDPRLRVACAALNMLRWLVPAGRRDDWEQEWQGELWHYLARSDSPTQPTTLNLAWRVAGALPHALRLRHNSWRLDMLGHDLRYAWRTTLRRPAFALLVSGTLALGIGANTAMFSVVNAVLIRPLPYPDPGQLVFMYGSFAKNPRAAMSPPDYLDYRAQNTVLRSFAARSIGGEAVLTGEGPPERVAAARVSANFFETLGVVPAYGRTFRPDEEQGEGHEVALLSAGVWQRRYGANPAIVGKTLVIDGRPTEIVGVLPRRLDLSLDFEIWRPLQLGTASSSIRRFHNLRGVGRLEPGVTLAQAQANFDIIARRLAATYPENETWSLSLVPYRDAVVGDLGRALVILLAAVGLVLLIACANVANLQLVRATTRQGEMVIRSALGADRVRLIRQLLTESLLVAALGGLLGLALAAGLTQVIRAVTATVLPRMAEVAIDGTVLGFTAALSLATGLLFGLAPALHTVRQQMTASLVSWGRGSGRGTRGRDLVVALQVAVSTVLLIGSGLLLRSLIELGRVDLGIDPAGVLTANLTLPETRFPNRGTAQRFWLSLTDRLASIPGVNAAAATTSLPMQGGSDTNYWLDGHPPTNEAERRNAMVVSVSDDYFTALRIPLVRGRPFAPAERNGGPPAMIVSQSLATRLFPGEDAVGRRLVVDFAPTFTGEIVGVAGDVKAFGVAGPEVDIIYFSAYQPAGFGIGYLNLVVRTQGDPANIAGSVRAAVAAIDPDLALADVATMASVVDGSTSPQRFSTRLLGAFSIAALALAIIGLYGVLAYAVSQRSIEIGIRLALGAEKTKVFGMVVWRGMAVVGSGIGLGVVGALWAGQLLESQLYRVTHNDPVVYTSVIGVLAFAGLAASVLPARRATRIDPISALKGS